MERIRRKLVLEDGSAYCGYGFGSMRDKFAELVFNTSMTGYQEIISDLSYTGQAVVMTYPLIGNYGICGGDFESDTPRISGLIVSEYCDTPSNFRCEQKLEDVMKEYDVAGIFGVDTRQITRRIRDRGSCVAALVGEQADTESVAGKIRSMKLPTDQAANASTKRIYDYSSPQESKGTIVVIDCGIKKNILRMMSGRGYKLTVVPYNTGAADIMSLSPSGVFISNGPGNPEDCGAVIQTIKELKGRIPIFGICLGHQIICLACGAKTYKLKFGHRGGNHPVKELATGKIEITSQNHSYAVVPESLAGTGLEITHINLLDNTVEGVSSGRDRLFSVQYHPESAPGPCDSAYLFDRFFEML